MPKQFLLQIFGRLQGNIRGLDYKKGGETICIMCVTHDDRNSLRCGMILSGHERL